MTTSEPIINSLLNRLTEARAELLAMETRREQLLADVAALERVVQMYPGGTAPTPQKAAPAGLAGLTLGEGLKQIARDNKGVLKVLEAKRLLLQAGKLKNYKNAGPRLYSHLARDPNFQRTSPGRFRLIENSSSQNGRLQLGNA